MSSRPAEEPSPARFIQRAYEAIGALLGQGGKTSAPNVLSLPDGTLPTAPIDKDRLRLLAHELIESLLMTFSQATSEKAAPFEDNVPLIHCVAPVQAGKDATVTVRVTNEDGAPSEVSLYCTDFVSDGGYEIPSLRVTFSPRRVTIGPKETIPFAVRVGVAQQTPPGLYCSLIQATGRKYVKAVLSLEVL